MNRRSSLWLRRCYGPLLLIGFAASPTALSAWSWSQLFSTKSATPTPTPVAPAPVVTPTPAVVPVVITLQDPGVSWTTNFLNTKTWYLSAEEKTKLKDHVAAFLRQSSAVNDAISPTDIPQILRGWIQKPPVTMPQEVKTAITAFDTQKAAVPAASLNTLSDAKSALTQFLAQLDKEQCLKSDAKKLWDAVVVKFNGNQSLGEAVATYQSVVTKQKAVQVAVQTWLKSAATAVLFPTLPVLPAVLSVSGASATQISEFNTVYNQLKALRDKLTAIAAAFDAVKKTLENTATTTETLCNSFNDLTTKSADANKLKSDYDKLLPMLETKRKAITDAVGSITDFKDMGSITAVNGLFEKLLPRVAEIGALVLVTAFTDRAKALFKTWNDGDAKLLLDLLTTMFTRVTPGFRKTGRIITSVFGKTDELDSTQVSLLIDGLRNQVESLRPFIPTAVGWTQGVQRVVAFKYGTTFWQVAADGSLAVPADSITVAVKNCFLGVANKNGTISLTSLDGKKSVVVDGSGALKVREKAAGDVVEFIPSKDTQNSSEFVQLTMVLAGSTKPLYVGVDRNNGNKLSTMQAADKTPFDPAWPVTKFVLVDVLLAETAAAKSFMQKLLNAADQTAVIAVAKTAVAALPLDTLDAAKANVGALQSLYAVFANYVNNLVDLNAVTVDNSGNLSPAWDVAIKSFNDAFRKAISFKSEYSAAEDRFLEPSEMLKNRIGEPSVVAIYGAVKSIPEGTVALVKPLYDKISMRKQALIAARGPVAVPVTTTPVAAPIVLFSDLFKAKLATNSTPAAVVAFFKEQLAAQKISEHVAVVKNKANRTREKADFAQLLNDFTFLTDAAISFVDYLLNNVASTKLNAVGTGLEPDWWALLTLFQNEFGRLLDPELVCYEAPNFVYLVDLMVATDEGKAKLQQVYGASIADAAPYKPRTMPTELPLFDAVRKQLNDLQQQLLQAVTTAGEQSKLDAFKQQLSTMSLVTTASAAAAFVRMNGALGGRAIVLFDQYVQQALPSALDRAPQKITGLLYPLLDSVKMLQSQLSLTGENATILSDLSKTLAEQPRTLIASLQAKRQLADYLTKAATSAELLAVVTLIGQLGYGSSFDLAAIPTWHRRADWDSLDEVQRNAIIGTLFTLARGNANAATPVPATTPDAIKRFIAVLDTGDHFMHELDAFSFLAPDLQDGAAVVAMGTEEDILKNPGARSILLSRWACAICGHDFVLTSTATLRRKLDLSPNNIPVIVQKLPMADGILQSSNDFVAKMAITRLNDLFAPELFDTLLVQAEKETTFSKTLLFDTYLQLVKSARAKLDAFIDATKKEAASKQLLSSIQKVLEATTGSGAKKIVTSGNVDITTSVRMELANLIPAPAVDLFAQFSQSFKQASNEAYNNLLTLAVDKQTEIFAFGLGRRFVVFVWIRRATKALGVSWRTTERLALIAKLSDQFKQIGLQSVITAVLPLIADPTIKLLIPDDLMDAASIRTAYSETVINQ